MKLNDTTTRLYIFESGHYVRHSHFDITEDFLSEINADLNLNTDNEDGIEITLEHIQEAMTKRKNEYPLIILKDWLDGEFELHDFISDYMYDNACYESVIDDVDYDCDYEEWSEK